MDVSAIPAANTMALASASQQLQSVMQTQAAMLRELAESQQQIAQMLAEEYRYQGVTAFPWSSPNKNGPKRITSR